MEGIMTVSELMGELAELPPDAPVMIAVVKYPSEFALRADVDGDASWDTGTDVEVIPLEAGEVTMQRGLVYMTVELEDYDESRRRATLAS